MFNCQAVSGAAMGDQIAQVGGLAVVCDKTPGAQQSDMYRRSLMITLCATCAACGNIPDIGRSLTAAERAAPFPDLLPLDQLSGIRPGGAQITDATTETLTSRLAALRARAARLQGPVIDPATRSQMRAAGDRAALR